MCVFVCVCAEAFYLYLFSPLSSLLPEVCQRVTHIIQHHTLSLSLSLPLQRRTGTKINTRVCHIVLSAPPLSFPPPSPQEQIFRSEHFVASGDCTVFIGGFTKCNFQTHRLQCKKLPGKAGEKRSHALNIHILHTEARRKRMREKMCEKADMNESGLILLKCPYTIDTQQDGRQKTSVAYSGPRHFCCH